MFLLFTFVTLQGTVLFYSIFTNVKKEEMDLKDRLLLIISRNNLNASTFAERLKIQRSNLSHILSGRNKPSIDFIEKFINHFPEEDVLWLISGKSNQKNNNISNNSQTNINQPLNNTNKNNSITNLTTLNKSRHVNKKILKIITFYEDNTFDVYQTNS